MKKTLPILLILAGLLTACGTAAETPADTSSVTEVTAGTEATAETEAYSAPAAEDMNGAALTILNYRPEDFNWANTTILVEAINGETLNDALYNREKAVEEAYNCQIDELILQDVVNTITKTVAAGDKAFDCAMVFDANVSGVLLSGSLTSWDVLGLDFSQPWWDSAATEQYNFYGIQAAVTGAYSLYNYSTRHCVVFNEKLKSELDIEDDFYQLVRDGKWTVDAMYTYGAMASADLDGDGAMKPKNDRYGMTGTVTRYYSSLLTGAGIRYIDRDNDGNLYYALVGNEAAQSYISKLVHLDTGNNIFTSGYNDIGNCDDTIFESERSLFHTTYVGDTVKLRDIEFDIGFLPPAKRDEAQEQYYSLVEGGAQTVLPKTVTEEDYHRIATLLNGFAYYSYEESIPAYIENLLKEKVARNEESAEMLTLCFDCSAYDLGTGVWSAETKNNFTKSIFLPRKDEVASMIAKTENSVASALADFTEAVGALTE